MLPIIRFTGELPERLRGRSQLADEGVRDSVRSIIAGVRERGDAALVEYTERFDHARLTPETIRVSEAEIDAAYDSVDARLLEAMRHSAARIRAYHEKQKKLTWLDFNESGYALGQKVTPLEQRGGVCAGRHGDVSVQRADERDTGVGGGCQAHSAAGRRRCATAACTR